MFEVNVKVIASGSTGNCSAVFCEGKAYLFDAGIRFSRIEAALDGNVPVAAFITHEHRDHAWKSTIRKLLRNGVNVYMSRGSFDALELRENPLLHLISAKSLTGLPTGDGALIEGRPTLHDAAEPFWYIFRVGGKSIAYITDTGAIDPFYGTFEHILIEADYDDAVIDAADISPWHRERVKATHLSAAQAERFFRASHLPGLKEVFLIHRSKRHSGADLLERVTKVLPPDVKVVLA